MSGFKSESISKSENENKNEINTFEISEELEALLNIRNYLDMQICALNEQLEFGEYLDASLSPFIESFSNEFKGHFPTITVEQDLQTLKKMLGEVLQQIKGVCKHQYEEDNIDVTDGCCENSMNITYCLICSSTF
jgi:hypothetical protein